MCMVFLGILALSNYSIQKTVAQEKTDSDDDTLLDKLVVPIAVAIIGAIATSWSFIQAKWNGHYFQHLILKELGELDPIEIAYEDGLLKSHMKKSFMHREILYNPTENKEFIFTVDNKLIYLARQVWSAFDNNDVEQFLIHLYFLTIDKRYRLYMIPIPYDRKGNIEKVLKEWIKIVKEPKEPKISVEKINVKEFFCFGKDETKVKREKINSKFLSATPKSNISGGAPIIYPGG
jgi:hypothetical protein